MVHKQFHNLLHTVAAFLLLAGVAQAQFQISGTVVNAVNDQPLAGAYVTITATQGAAARTVTTGADGAFRFDGVSAGK